MANLEETKAALDADELRYGQALAVRLGETSDGYHVARLCSRVAAAEAGATLAPEIREILRDVAGGVTGPDLRGRAAAAIIKRDLCPRCADTGHELLDTGGRGVAWGTCHRCATPPPPAAAPSSAPSSDATRGGGRDPRLCGARDP
jgi:hypothetical protein